MANPRIDELRKRLDKDPASRLFAQLAEELRKEGELEDAIRVCREGLAKHPSYPAARMTLGRALLDSGDYAGARAEFEAVVKGVPDNALAHRFLGECQQALGDAAAATASYRAALMFAPGDAESAGRLAALTGEAPPARPAPQRAPAPPTPARPMAAPAAAPRPPAAPPPPPSRPPVAARPAPPPPPPPAVATARAEQAPPAALVPPPAPGPEAAAPEPIKPVPLAPAAEDFELEAAHEAAPVALTSEDAAPREGEAAVEVTPEPAPIKLVDVGEDEVFELERPVEAAPTKAPPPPPPPAPPAVPPAVVKGEGREEAEFDLDVEQPAAAAPGEAPAPPLATATLAELYLQQGAREQAQAVLKQVLAREPENERARELSLSSAATLDPKAQRRAALERTIERLERMLDAVQRARA
ncbi:MAG: tetratricopeptide repeat protein [Vicinamibacteria bacterium]|nr:tetratricopeptide repeat protein [Vicinamibacteria bacterium]